MHLNLIPRGDSSKEGVRALFSRGIPTRPFAYCLILMGLLSLRSQAQEISLLPLAPLDESSIVMVVPGPLDQVTEPEVKPIALQSASQQQQPQVTQRGTSRDRILWTLPNFLTVENADRIPPLTSGQKFKVVARGVFDPFEFVLIGFVTGLGQASDSNPSYGQGAQGYAKRYGTAYADNAIENFMASAVFPSVLHQDPRYYQLGDGGFLKRSAHAVSRVIITRSDSGQTQINYSELLGGATAGAISTYTYHPQSERGFGNVMSVWASQMGWDAVTYMIKEFWPDLRKRSQKNKN
jgi:hypothetical protein